MNKSITFILPGSAESPIGGFKTVFEYSNGLAVIGYNINIVLCHTLFKHNPFSLQWLKSGISYYKYKLSKKYLPQSWFPIESSIKIFYIPYLDEKFISETEITVLTSWHTAKISGEFSEKTGKKIYFIQSFETWHGKYEDVVSTWKMPYKKIVISKWLQELGNSFNEDTVYIPNGLDSKAFGMDINPEKRNPISVCMLYHENEVKGSKIGLSALEILKRENQEMKVTMFGVYERPSIMPDWIVYVKNPSQKHLRKIYNESAILINPSLMEGFPLIPAEATLCGAAILVSDIGGHKEYAIDGETALLFPSGDINALAEKLKILLNDSNYRIKLAYEGNRNIKKFNWENSISKFDKLIKDIISGE